MENTKITSRKVLTYALNLIKGEDTEPLDDKVVIAKLEAMIAAIDKKNASPKKVTEKQAKNEIIKDALLAFLRESCPKGFTCSELMKSIPIIHENENETPQHISALLRLLVLDGKIEKYAEKRKTYFKVVE